MVVNPETCYSTVNESRAINTAHQNRWRKVRWINRAEEANQDKGCDHFQDETKT